MGIYIKGMEMPKDCNECWDKCLHAAIDCKAHGDPQNGTIRCDDCPLIEVSEPHGRLVDADTLKERINTTFWSEIGAIIDNAPTIIESEVEE